MYIKNIHPFFFLNSVKRKKNKRSKLKVPDNSIKKKRPSYQQDHQTIEKDFFINLQPFEK